MRKSNASWFVTALVLAGCSAVGAPGTDPSLSESTSDAAASTASGSGAGAGGATSTGGTGGSILFEDSGTDSGQDNCSKVIKAVIRDFKMAQSPGGHPDFEAPLGFFPTTGLLQSTLGPDQKPVFAMSGGGMITSATSFYQWYHDTPGVNQTIEVDLPLTKDAAGLDTYDSMVFFPIDGQGFGNEGLAHNFHFTTEVHLKFTYIQGTPTNPRIFSFEGDDDLWLFVNGRLALDLGGVHFGIAGLVNLDTDAVKLGITAGGDYQMDIFHAERHTDGSHFKVQTSIDCITPVDVPH